MTPSQKTEINNLITEIDKKIILAALIPSSFDPRQAPLGTDLDLYDDICGGFKSGENHSYEDLLDYLTSTTDLLSKYLKVHFTEISGLHYIDYGINCVNACTNLGIVYDPVNQNFIKNHQTIRLSIGETLTINKETLNKIKKSEKNEYQVFINAYNEYQEAVYG